MLSLNDRGFTHKLKRTLQITEKEWSIEWIVLLYHNVVLPEVFYEEMCYATFKYINDGY